MFGAFIQVSGTDCVLVTFIFHRSFFLMWLAVERFVEETIQQVPGVAKLGGLQETWSSSFNFKKAL